MSKSLLTRKNSKCYHYGKFENPIIKIVEYEKGEQKKLETDSNIIFMVLRGKGKISFGKFVNKSIKSGDILLLAAHTQVQFQTNEQVIILVFRLPSSIAFCRHFSLETLFERRKKKKKEQFITLKINNRIKLYLNSLISCLNDGLNCHYFLELKMNELFFLLQAYHTKEDLAAFFSPMVTKNSDFYALVLANYKSVKTVEELAQKMGISPKALRSRFKKAFGTSPQIWITERLAENLLHEITCTKKSFAEIGKTLGFSSPSHLTGFCKLKFGVNPTTLRENGIVEMGNDG